MLGHGIEQFHVRSIESWMEGSRQPDQGKEEAFWGLGKPADVGGKQKGCRSHEAPGWGHLACEQSVEGQDRGCDVGLYG